MHTNTSLAVATHTIILSAEARHTSGDLVNAVHGANADSGHVQHTIAGVAPAQYTHSVVALAKYTYVLVVDIGVKHSISGQPPHTVGAAGATATHTIAMAIVNSFYVCHISSPPPIINRILWAPSDLCIR